MTLGHIFQTNPVFLLFDIYSDYIKEDFTNRIGILAFQLKSNQTQFNMTQFIFTALRSKYTVHVLILTEVLLKGFRRVIFQNFRTRKNILPFPGQFCSHPVLPTPAFQNTSSV